MKLKFSLKTNLFEPKTFSAKNITPTEYLNGMTMSESVMHSSKLWGYSVGCNLHHIYSWSTVKKDKVGVLQRFELGSKKNAFLNSTLAPTSLQSVDKTC